VVAIELADRREPGLNLHAVGDLPDRHEAFLGACSAELVRRVEQEGVRFAAGEPRSPPEASRVGRAFSYWSPQR
jgi:hypothetical protein